MQKRLALYKIDEDKYISVFIYRDNPYVYIRLMESELDDITPMPNEMNHHATNLQKFPLNCFDMHGGDCEDSMYSIHIGVTKALHSPSRCQEINHQL